MQIAMLTCGWLKWVSDGFFIAKKCELNFLKSSAIVTPSGELCVCGIVETRAHFLFRWAADGWGFRFFLSPDNKFEYNFYVQVHEKIRQSAFLLVASKPDGQSWNSNLFTIFQLRVYCRVIFHKDARFSFQGLETRPLINPEMPFLIKAFISFYWKRTPVEIIWSVSDIGMLSWSVE